MNTTTFVDDTLNAILAISPQVCFETNEVPSRTDLFQGAAGVAFFLHEIARLRNDRRALVVADEWCSYAERLGPDATPTGPDGRALPNSANAVFMGTGGIAYVRFLISLRAGDHSKVDRASDTFRTSWKETQKLQGSAAMDLMFGTAGFACAAQDLLDRGGPIPMSATTSLRDVVRESRGCIVNSLQRPLHAREMAGTALAHGVACELFAGLRTEGPHDLLTVRLREFIDLAINQPPLMLWPTKIGTGELGPWPASWCNGIAGILLLMCLAARKLPLHHFRVVARQAAITTFRLRAPAQIGSLCCGSAGQALALAEYANISGDEVYRGRARRRLNEAILRAPYLPLERLWQGRLGIAIAALTMRRGGHGFPVLTYPRGDA